MGLADYVIQPDMFEIDDECNVPYRGALAFPCCVCKHCDLYDDEKPCNQCGHNVNAPTCTPIRPEEGGEMVKFTHRGANVTVYSGESEVIVYGSGSDWLVQYSKITNHCKGWRRWFAYRSDAEEDAMELASKPYAGRRKQGQDDDQKGGE